MDQKLLLVNAFLLLGFAITCKATTYMVGDNSGWDISTNLDTWAKDKTFNVGDVLVFQYSSSNSVSEVTKENFDSCNTTNVLETYSAGNTTITLKKPGERYFVSGNKLYCLGGMKLHVHVENNQAYAPAGAPQATPGSDQTDFPNPSSKSNNNIPTSTAFSHIGETYSTIVLGFLGLVVSMLWNVIN
ncbi:Phytocyanin domain containing protein [Parasponia andersonii]|uniref:Phytocyanin domain containing protein n=1 Tax=Parasponia andersonii TaxID=3476 RepID=A0A2P5CG38_PARAD|nr:Phytocyanin domain containing protein [Parasponia andersonii]